MIELVETKKRKKTTRPSTDVISVVSLFNKFSTYPSAGLTPERLAAILKEADQGDVFRQSELFEEMLEKDPRLFGMFQARKLGVTKRDYTIISASDSSQHKAQADFVRMVFNRMKNFRGTLADILDAVPKGFSALQVLWDVQGDKIGINGFEWTHQKNFRWGKASDPKSDLKEIRRITDGNLVDGIELEPYKWLTAVIQARSGHPARTSVMRTCAFMYLFKNFGVKAWVQLAEIFGIPLRIGKYPASEANNTELLNRLEAALRNMGQDASAMIPDSMQIDIVESIYKASSQALHGDLAGFCDRQNSVAVLGHEGAAESTPGKLGGEDGALEAVYTITESDALSLDYIISDQIIVPLIDFNFGEQDEYPYYKTLISPPKNKLELVDVYDGAINRIGLPIAQKDVYEDLGLRIPEEGEEVIVPRPQYVPQQPMSFHSPLHAVIAGGVKKKIR